MSRFQPTHRRPPAFSSPYLQSSSRLQQGAVGNLWVAANQCAGASAACVQAIHQFNTILGDVGCNGHVPDLCYSLAIDHSLAQLYVSWGAKDEGNLVIHIQRVASFPALKSEALLHASTGG